MDPVLRLRDVTVRFDDVTALAALDWEVRPGERWVVVGANGSGKTTLLRVAGAWLRPSSGTVDIDGERVGRTDLRSLRRRIGFASQALSDQFRPGLRAHDVVLAARNAALEAFWHRYSPADVAEATDQLRAFGVDEGMAGRGFTQLSSGERQRVLLARAFTGSPRLVVLDEPTAGLDVGGREDLLLRLDRSAGGSEAAVVLVTHHLEEVPPSWTHALLLHHGEGVAAGPVDEVLTSARLSELYGLALQVERRRGRWSAVAA